MFQNTMPFSSLNGFQDPNWMYQTNSFSDAFGGVQEMVPLADEKPQFPMDLNFDLNDVSNPDWLHDASSLNLPGGSELPAAPQFDANPQTIQPSLLEKTDPELERLGMPRAGDAAAAAPKQTLEARIGSLEQRLDGMEEQIR